MQHTARAHSHLRAGPPAPQPSHSSGRPPHRNTQNLQKVTLETAPRSSWESLITASSGQSCSLYTTHTRCQEKRVGHGTEQDKGGAQGLCPAVAPRPPTMPSSPFPGPHSPCSSVSVAPASLPCSGVTAAKPKNPQEGPDAPFVQEGASCGPCPGLAERRVLKGRVLGALAGFAVAWLLLLYGKGLLVGT